MLLVGVDHDTSVIVDDENDHAYRFPFCMLQTDPSGAVAQQSFPPLSQSQQIPFLKVIKIVGGRPEARSRIEKAIGKQSDKYHSKQRRGSASTTNNGKSGEATIWERLQVLSKILMEEQQQQEDQQQKRAKQPGRPISELIFGRKKKRVEDPDNTSADPQEDPPRPSNNTAKQPWIEAVVVSRELGIHKLTGAQIQQLLRDTDY